jgi:hypothetical protein
MERHNRATTVGHIRVQVSGERASILDKATGEVAEGRD